MTPELLQKIESLLPIYEELKTKGSLPYSFDVEKRLLLKEIWDKNIMIGSNLCIDCPGVMAHSLHIVFSYYEREKPKIEATEEKAVSKSRKKK